MRNLPYKFFLVLFIASFPTLALGQETPEGISPLSPEKPVIEQSESAPAPLPIPGLTAVPLSSTRPTNAF